MTHHTLRFDAESVRESWDGEAVKRTALHATLEDWFGWIDLVTA